MKSAAISRRWLTVVGVCGILAACSPTPAGVATETATRTSVSATPEETPKISPSPEPTATATANTLESAPTTQAAAPAFHFCTPDYQVFKLDFPLARPISNEGRDNVDASYRYGTTSGGTLEPHSGVEFNNSSGTPVLAAAEGVVLRAGDDAEELAGPYKNYYGNLVVLEHDLPGFDQTIFTLYAHLSEILVAEGQRVEAGEQVGLVGATGIAAGSHLHFEVRVGENSFAHTRNPELWLRPRTDENGEPYGVLLGYLLDAQAETVYVPNVVVEYIPPSGDETEAPRPIYLEAYADESVNADPRWGENFAVGDLPAGQYRVSLIAGGFSYKIVEVQPGALTAVPFCSAEN